MVTEPAPLLRGCPLGIEGSSSMQVLLFIMMKEGTGLAPSVLVKGTTIGLQYQAGRWHHYPFIKLQHIN